MHKIHPLFSNIFLSSGIHFPCIRLSDLSADFHPLKFLRNPCFHNHNTYPPNQSDSHLNNDNKGQAFLNMQNQMQLKNNQ